VRLTHSLCPRTSSLGHRHRQIKPYTFHLPCWDESVWMFCDKRPKQYWPDGLLRTSKSVCSRPDRLVDRQSAAPTDRTAPRSIAVVDGDIPRRISPDRRRCLLVEIQTLLLVMRCYASRNPRYLQCSDPFIGLRGESGRRVFELCLIRTALQQ
jgi:hypothetical protein